MKRTLKLDDVELAYLAGFFDADGSVCIGKYVDQRNRKKNVKTLVIDVGQTDKRILILFKSRFGGSIQKTVTPKGKPYYHWRLSFRKARNFAEEILPYLIQKRDKTKKCLKEALESRSHTWTT